MRKTLRGLAGRTIEKILLEALKQRLAVIPTAEFPCLVAGKGPCMLDNGDGLTMPDFQVHGKSIRGWVDCKAKSEAMDYRKWHRLEHGIDLSCWDAYLEIQQVTDLLVYLFVLELNTRGILAADLNTLRSVGSPRNGYWDSRRANPNINFDRAAFALVGTWDVPSDDLRKTEIRIQWDKVESIMRQVEFGITE